MRTALYKQITSNVKYTLNMDISSYLNWIEMQIVHLWLLVQEYR